VIQASDGNFEVRLARDERDVLGAQRLRYHVFVEELGADGPLVDHHRRLERDRFDPFFDHLVLVDLRRDPESLEHVAGVYRLMSEAAAARAGRFYSEDEYDLAPLRAAGRPLLELGRSCVAARMRGSAALLLLWQGLGAYVTEHGIELLFGVASFHGTDPAALAHPLAWLHYNHLAPEALRPRARATAFAAMDAIPRTKVDRGAALRALPPLIKSYLRLGGTVGEGAFIDHAFNTIDVLLIMDTAMLSARQRALYARTDGAGESTAGPALP
jgi:putative hemolysin